VPDPTTLVPAIAQIASDASALHRALRVHPADRASVLTMRIKDAQQLAGTALRLFLTLGPQASQPTPADLLLLHQVA
jgi:hypothetical protein